MSNDECTYEFGGLLYTAAVYNPSANRWRITAEPDHPARPATWFAVGKGGVWVREGCKAVFPSLKAVVADIDTDPCRESREHVAESLFGEGFSTIQVTDGAGNRTERVS